jgi:hypothetical protein
MISASIKITTFNCKGYKNNKKLILELMRKNDVCFLTETWIGEWDPDVLCDIKLAGYQVYTTSRKRQGQKKGRQSCMSAFIIKDKYKKIIKLEYVNKRISILKINTADSDLEGGKGYALIGVYLSSNNNLNSEYEIDLGVLNNTCSRMMREGYKPLIAGDMNADSSRHKYTNDFLLKAWLQRSSFTEISRLYTQRVPNTFLSSRGQTSNIDHFIIGSNTPWPEVTQVNMRSSALEV